MVAAPFMAAVGHVTQCISRDGPGASIYCTSTYFAACTQPGMGLLFRSCRRASGKGAWRDYLGSLRASSGLADNLTRRRSDHLSLMLGLLRSSESIGRQSEELSGHGTIDVSAPASAVVSATSGLASSVLDFHNSVDLVSRGSVAPVLIACVYTDPSIQSLGNT